MARTTLDIQIVGPGIQPETVPLRELLAVLDDIEQLISRSTQAVTGQSTQSELTLAAINSGSITIELRGEKEHERGSEFLAEAIARNDAKAPPWMRKHTRSLWRFAKEFECAIGLGTHRFTSPLVFVRPNVEPFSPPTVVGTTSVVGTLQRVGGRKPHATAQLRLPNGDRLTAYLTGEEMAKQLGERLYQSVALEGQAVWDTTDWSIDSFKATRIADFVESPVISTFAAMAELSAGHWDNIDPDKFVRSLRDD